MKPLNLNPRTLCVYLALIAIFTAFAVRVEAKSCAAMQKELGELRQEYHLTAIGESPKPTFDMLMEILDKIVELKRSMRGVNCKIPDRSAPGVSKEEPKKPRAASKKKPAGSRARSEKK